MKKQNRSQGSKNQPVTPPTADQLEAELARIRQNRRFRRSLGGAVYILLVVAAACVLAVGIFFPILQIYGDSMEPALGAGDVVVAVKGADPEPGDVIGFYFQGALLVKRVVAAEGDVVDIDGAGNVFVNGRALSEPYLTERACGEVDIELPCQVPEGSVFVLGDHRSVSVDSRSAEIGCVAEDNIIGKILFRVWPLGRLGLVR